MLVHFSYLIDQFLIVIFVGIEFGSFDVGGDDFGEEVEEVFGELVVSLLLFF